MTNESTANPLQALSDALAGAVERAAASTVRVNARRRMAASGIAWTADGLILTADHVVEQDDGITIGLPAGGETTAQLVGRDPGTDIAVLRVAAGSVPAIERAPEGSATVGAIALAVGRPFSDGPMASLGVIGAVGVWGGGGRGPRGGRPLPYIRSDVSFYPGFSGGPLVDAAGRAIGLNSSQLGRGAGLTVPASVANEVVQALVQHGRIRRGYLGIGSQPVSLPEALAARLTGQRTGLLVATVESGSPADSAGLLIGDILVRLDGVTIGDADDLQALLLGERIGRPTPVTVLRGGEPRDLTVTIGERT